MPNDSAAAMAPVTPAVGSDDLAQGLLLVQSSAIKVVRLQLAMERRDRRVALETVDELMRLDRRISAFLDELPVSAATMSAAREEVAAQGRVLAREKFALAAGTAGPRLSTERARWAELPPDPAPEPAPIQVEPAAEVPRGRAGSRRSAVVLTALVAIVLVVAAAVAFLFLSGTGEPLVAALGAMERFW